MHRTCRDRRLGKLVVCLWALLSATSAQGAEPSARGWYFGGNGGQTSIKLDDSRLNSALSSSSLVATSTTKDERDIGLKIFVGWRYDKYVSLEHGYFNLGKSRISSLVSPSGSVTGETKTTGVFLDIVGAAPVGDWFENLSVIGRMGLQYSRTKINLSAEAPATLSASIKASQKQSGYDVKLGLGVQYNMSKAAWLRAEWERYRVGNGIDSSMDADLFSVGFAHRF